MTLPIFKLLEEPTLAPPNLLMTGELHFLELEYVFLHARDGVCKRAVGNIIFSRPKNLRLKWTISADQISNR